MWSTSAALIVLAAASLAGCRTKDEADLEYTGMTVSPVNPLPGDTVTVTVTLANHGDDDAGAFGWAVNRDSDVAVITGSHGGIAEGQSSTITFPVTQAAGGSYVYRIVLNSDNAVSESDYENNSGALAITFALAIDLQVAPLVVSPASPTTLTPITVTATVTNSAAAPGTASGVAWRVMRDGVDNYASGTVDTLAPGASADVTFTVPAETAGNHTYQFTTDPDHRSTDSDRTNDVQSTTVSVAVGAAKG